MLISIFLGSLALAALAWGIPRLLSRRRAARYAELLAECLDRQPHHEREHAEAHGGTFTSGLRIEAIARRFERKIHAAGLPMLSVEDRRRMARRALWPPA